MGLRRVKLKHFFQVDGEVVRLVMENSEHDIKKRRDRALGSRLSTIAFRLIETRIRDSLVPHTLRDHRPSEEIRADMLVIHFGNTVLLHAGEYRPHLRKPLRNDG